MTRAEIGISLGYGGIWNEIGYSEEYLKEKVKQPKKVMKYERVLDWDYEDAPLYGDSKEVAQEKWLRRKTKYFIDGDAIYKLVHEDGELYSWMNGRDPIEEWKRTHDENGKLIKH